MPPLVRRSQQILRMRSHISPSQLQRPVIVIHAAVLFTHTLVRKCQKHASTASPNIHVRMHENVVVCADQRQRLATGTSAVRLLRCALHEYKLGSVAVLFKYIFAEWFLMTYTCNVAQNAQCQIYFVCHRSIIFNHIQSYSIIFNHIQS